MDPETLVTFSFRAPHHVRTVELLGSWDNFSRPYTLYHDKRRGQGFWTGCFQFHDIVFDGFEVDYSRPRTGGLKQGGMYWYYFRLDDSMEAYDDSRACTADCPLMPGQMVNVIDVPREVTESPLTRCASADLIGTLSQQQSLHTMNPRAKYLPLDPPPVSKVHERCISDLALGGRLERPKKSSSSTSSSENEREMAPAKKMLGAVRRGLSLTGSLRTMASRAALRARVRLEATTYEASLVDESSERASIGPSRSMLESSRPQTRRPLVETYQPTTGNRFQTFPQVVGIPTPSASPAKQHRLQDSDAASLGPQSICNVQFLSSSPEEQQQKQQPRHYSLSNPDSEQPTPTTHDPTLPTQTEQRSPSEFSISSPTFSDATISTTEGGEIATPSDVLTDEDDDAHMRWGHAMRNYDPYRLPDDEPVLFMSKVSKMIPAPSGPTSDAIRLSKLGEGEGRSIAEAVFSELGYLGDSIQ
ncbi:hypothetical protein Q7P37_010666 [Cladosporium fusiforme]